MDSPANRGHGEDAGLGSAEYRTRLLTKLNCLIAVLEVAIAKITRSMEQPGANEERLQRIRANLENTLSICNRAKHTLERGLTGPAPAARPQLPARRDHADAGPNRMTYRDYVELSSIDEYRKFRTLPPIEREHLDALDVEDLIRRLQG
jgi:hypothetical protein